MNVRQHTIVTSHGSIAVEERGEGGLPVLLIHGNSSCRGVFRYQLQGRLAEKRRVISFDLPGHGDSSNAHNPARSYTASGFADATLELLDKLGVADAVVFGWSLGGHIAMQMVPRFAGMQGLLICGSPPVGRDNMTEGFRASAHMKLASQESLSDAEIDSFVGAIYGGTADPFLRAAAARADGRFRKRLFEAVRVGEGVDQRQVVERSRIPLAVVNGSADSLVNVDYFDRVAYANQWENICFRLAGLGHAPFWQAPSEFNPILERFVRDVETGRAARAI